LMLDYLGENEASRKIFKAVAGIIKKGKDVTYDLKQDRNDSSAVGTKEIADAIVKEIKKI